MCVCICVCVCVFVCVCVCVRACVFKCVAALWYRYHLPQFLAIKTVMTHTYPTMYVSPEWRGGRRRGVSRGE